MALYFQLNMLLQLRIDDEVFEDAEEMNHDRNYTHN